MERIKFTTEVESWLAVRSTGQATRDATADDLRRAGLVHGCPEDLNNGEGWRLLQECGALCGDGILPGSPPITDIVKALRRKYDESRARIAELERERDGLRQAGMAACDTLRRERDTAREALKRQEPRDIMLSRIETLVGECWEEWCDDSDGEDLHDAIDRVGGERDDERDEANEKATALGIDNARLRTDLDAAKTGIVQACHDAHRERDEARAEVERLTATVEGTGPTLDHVQRRAERAEASERSMRPVVEASIVRVDTMRGANGRDRNDSQASTDAWFAAVDAYRTTGDKPTPILTGRWASLATSSDETPPPDGAPERVRCWPTKSSFDGESDLWDLGQWFSEEFANTHFPNGKRPVEYIRADVAETDKREALEAAAERGVAFLRDDKGYEPMCSEELRAAIKGTQ